MRPARDEEEGRQIKRLSLLAAATVVTLTIGAATTASAVTARDARPAGSCRQPTLSGTYVHRIASALRARRDLWGERLLASRNGPTFEGASRYLKPLFLARAANGRPLTDSGVHYAPFAQPEGAWGATSVALHVADGSQIVSEKAHGRRVTVAVGRRGLERFGSCLARLSPPRLDEGYLPILETRYVDTDGVRYRQESFAARVDETESLVSFVRVIADASASEGRLTRIRITPSTEHLASADGRLSRKGHTYLFFSPGGSFNGSSVKYAVPPGTTRTIYLAWLNSPMSSRPLFLDETSYDAAREAVRGYWERRLVHGGTISVPEDQVMDAERSLLIQNLALTWRYSIGNAYEQFSSPEGIDVSRVMAEYGQGKVSRAILHTSFRKRPARLKGTPVRNPNWKMGARLVGTAQQAWLTGDTSLVVRATPVLRRYVRTIGRQIQSSRLGLLRRERYSSDVPDRVYGLHSQAVVWQGLRSMGQVWASTGHTALARKCARLAARLGNGLERAIRRSRKRLPDGSLFVPVRLLDDEQPYRSVTASRDGSYWNLVVPYALASGLFKPRTPQTLRIFEYMERHGSRILGVPRSGAYALYGAGTPGGARTKHPVSGSNPVYGLNVARFLADNDLSGQLVLSLYGELAAAMAPGTFVSGEGVSIAPLAGGHFRAMYLPPNGASNAAFLETLRLMLIHETIGPRGAPRGLELAYATPRSWLRPGQTIRVSGMPTSFGRLSYSIERAADSVHVELDIPGRARLGSLRLRLRLPNGERVASVLYDVAVVRTFEPSTGTITLPTRPGRHELEVQLASS
jgi:hypothetical protein